MTHPDVETWIDFIRGVEAAGPEADAHLSAGCARCRGTVAFLQRVAATAATEGQYAVPDKVEMAAKGLYLPRRPEKLRLLPRLAATLVHGGRLDLAPAGVRTLRRSGHHALYEAGDYAVDVRLEHDPAAAHVHLVGQVARRERGRPLANAPVLLMAGRSIVAHASSNRFGEFQVEYSLRPRLRLCVATSDGRIDVPLSGLGPRGPKARRARATKRTGRGKQPKKQPRRT